MNPNRDATDPTRPAADSILHSLAEQLARLGPRLAQLEFESLCREIEAGGWQELVLSFNRPGAGQGALLTAPPVMAVAPALQVPLGRIAWAAEPLALPVVAIDVPALPPRALAAQLSFLLSEHHRKPFMRPVFLCATTAPLALLGRYGFAVLCRGATPAVDVAKAESDRLAIVELRRLSDAIVLWRA